MPVMLAANQLRDPLIDSLQSALLETHRTKISLLCAKTGSSYPTIWMPRTLSKLVGLPTHTCLKVHKAALASRK
jgi:hypothetical protein